MELEGNTPESKIAQELPKLGTSFLQWQGRRLPMIAQAGGWRLRSRSKSFQVDLFFSTSSLVEAKRLARGKLADLPERIEKPKGTLEDIVVMYLAAPKRCSQDTAEGNVSRLRSVARDAFGKTLEQIRTAEIPMLWPAYVAARQGLKQPDYATRRKGNYAINSAMKQAASVFLPALRPYYRRHGLSLPDDATITLWAAQAPLERPEARERDLIRAWIRLRKTDVDLWLVVGMARFAGLRQSEILACRGHWIRRSGSHVDLRDREDEGYFHKTGQWYSAAILSRKLAQYLTAIPLDSSVITRPDRARWIQRVPQAWLKQFTGTAKAPLHRLRGLYADHVRWITESAILARAEGIKAASRALGHTSTATTERHYTSRDPG